jgi:ATP-dependent helicase/nuclease subunit A
LEFHTVLIPFCDWKLLSSVNFQVWCPPGEEPFNQLDLLPIDYKAEMSQSIFGAEYAEETLQLWVDALNLLYVAFTRAKQNLYVFCRGNDDLKNYSKPTTISNLMQDALKTGSVSGSYSEAKSIPTENEEESVSEATFLYGTFSLGVEKASDKPISVLRERGIDIALPFRSFAHKTRFRQSNRSREFCKGRDPNGFTTTFIDRGKLLHRLFSDIKHKDDVSDALQALINEGLLEQKDAQGYETYVQNALKIKEAEDWYSGTYRLFNECSILCPGPDGKLQLKRPDRVMLKDNRVQVVDFKFGKPSPSYHKQVQEYMQLLTDMGYAGVTGYLWYVDENQVVKV